MRWFVALSLAAGLGLQASAVAAQYVPPTLVFEWAAVNLWDPAGLAVDPAGTVYLVDLQFNTLQAFTEDGTFLRGWGGYGSADGLMNSPRDVAIGPDGNIYVADGGNSRIQVFTPAGVFLRKWGSPGYGDGQFGIPSAIDIASDGTVFVLDVQYPQSPRVQVFAADGTYLRRWSVTLYPARIALDGLGGLWVPDYVAGQARKYSLTGTALATLGTTQLLNSPRSIAFDRSGRIYVGTVDPGVCVFAPNLARLGQFPTDQAPVDMTFDAGDNLVMCGGRVVSVYSTQVATPTRSGTWGRLKAAYR